VFSATAALVILAIISLPTAAFDDMTNVAIEVTPSETTEGAMTLFSVTVHNGNDRSLVVGSITIQIFEGSMMVSDPTYKLYTVDVKDGMVPGQGTRTFEHRGSAPDFFGMCSVLVTITGTPEGSTNMSFGMQSTSIWIEPSIFGTMGISFLLIVLLIIIFPAVIIVAVVLVLRKNGRGSGDQAPVCPHCGALRSPGSTFCEQCGRKL
jgi:hypothetical protein